MLTFQKLGVHRCSIEFAAVATDWCKTVPRGHAEVRDQLLRAGFSHCRRNRSSNRGGCCRCCRKCLGSRWGGWSGQEYEHEHEHVNEHEYGYDDVYVCLRRRERNLYDNDRVDR